MHVLVTLICSPFQLPKYEVYVTVNHILPKDIHMYMGLLEYYFRIRKNYEISKEPTCMTSYSEAEKQR